MDSLAIMAIISNRATTDLAHSALPEAPIVPVAEKRVRASVRTRAALATLLRRLADAVAPPARQVASARGQ
jgi:hypothetical protein